MIALLLASLFFSQAGSTQDPADAPIVAIYYTTVGCSATELSAQSTLLMYCGDSPCPCYGWKVYGFKNHDDFLLWLKSLNRCPGRDSIRVFGATLPACRMTSKKVQPPPETVESAEWEEK